MPNVAVVAPAERLTDAGTTADASLLDRETTTPPAGAGPVRLTVPVDPVPPATDAGTTDRLERVAALTLRTAFFVVPFAVPEIVAATFVAVGVVVTVKVPVVAPAATVTPAGTTAAGLLLVRATVKPPDGAAEVSVTVPEDAVPPTTVAGLKETLERTGGLIVRVAVFVTAAAVAVIVAVVTVPTATVVTVKVAVVAPCATVTLAGTVAVPLLLVRFTAKPPVCAGAARVTVPVDEVPPAREAGLNATETSASVTGLMVSEAVFVTPTVVAVIVAVVIAPTKVVETLNVAVVAPAATVTLAGTVVAPLSLARLTAKPPVGALLVSVTVPVDDDPPFTAVGLRARAESDG